MVVEEQTAYNIILGRPTLNEAKAVIIPALMLIKYERDDGSVGSLNGDQKTARECYLSAVKETVAADGQGKEPIDLDNVKDAPSPHQQAVKREKLQSWWW